MAPLLLIVNLHRQNAGSVIKEKMMEHTDRVEPAAVDWERDLCLPAPVPYVRVPIYHLRIDRERLPMSPLETDCDIPLAVAVGVLRRFVSRVQNRESDYPWHTCIADTQYRIASGVGTQSSRRRYCPWRFRRGDPLHRRWQRQHPRRPSCLLWRRQWLTPSQPRQLFPLLLLWPYSC